MPKVPMDYSKCSIYKIEHIDDESLVYVGHTTCFNKRKTAHKSNCKNENYKYYNIKVYQMIRENGGWDMFKMIEVEKYPCADRREAERRENEVIKELRASMNMRNSFLTQDEITEYKKDYYELHKEKLQQHQKDYYELHKEKLQQQMKEYQKNNKPKIQELNKEYYELHKEKLQEYQKDYYESNKPKIQEYKKEYQKNNKPKIQEYKKEYRESNKLKIQERDKEYREANKQKINEKVKCECGCDVMKRNLKRHQVTKTHLDKMKNT